MPNKVSKEVTREREERAWELRQQGWTQERIAAALGVERSTIGKMLARIDQRVLKLLNEAVESMKVSQTSRLERHYDELMQAWERSKQPAKSQAKRVVKKPAGEGEEDAPEAEETVTQQVSGQDGDTKYLREGRDTLADLRNLWGLDAPKKHALTTAKGDDVCLDDLKDLLKKAKNWTPEADAGPAAEPTTLPEATP